MSVEINVMQRLHEEDATALDLKNDNVKHICLPAEVSKHVKPEELKERYIDGLLDPVRLDRDVMAEMKKKLGSYGYAGQFEQTPAPDEGGMIKREYFGRFTMDQLPPDITWNFVADTAYTSKEENDPSGFIAYAEHNNNYYLRNVCNVRLEFPELMKHAKSWPLANGYTNRSRYQIEPKASGKSLVQTVRSTTGLNISESINPTKDKTARVRDVEPILESKRVFLLAGEPWIDDFLTQLAQFPNGNHDEMVDCVTMILNGAHRPKMFFGG